MWEVGVAGLEPFCRITFAKTFAASDGSAYVHIFHEKLKPELRELNNHLYLKLRKEPQAFEYARIYVHFISFEFSFCVEQVPERLDV